MEKIELLSKLGLKMQSLIQDEKAIVAKARVENPWFTEHWVSTSAVHWGLSLSPQHIQNWLKPYSFPSNSTKKVGIIMAGNIPFVGLHDLLSVVACGATAVCKLSSNDQTLMKWAIQILKDLDPRLQEKIVIVDNRLDKVDALIATGSDNSARYFEHYFKDIPKIIRKNRSSIAVIDKDISAEQLALLANDIFTYFGMGCRNVGKVFLPKGFDVVKMIDAFEGYKDLIHHHKYANNYTYHKAILLMNLDKHLDNGFLVLQEKEMEIKPPLSILFYTFYSDKNEIIQEFKDSDQIQCMVGKGEGLIPFGNAQKPALNDYADKVDVVDFILSI